MTDFTKLINTVENKTSDDGGTTFIDSEDGGSAFILLDKSGSMSGTRWTESINSINEFVDAFKEQNVDTKITVVAFDGGQNGLNFDILREGVSSLKWNKLSTSEDQPRGNTPLYDATAKILDLAENEKSEKTVIVIVTDGGENGSREYKLSNITSRIEECKKKKWEVLFLGSEFNADVQTQSYGLDLSKTISVSSAGEMKNVMRDTAARTMAYYRTGDAIDMKSNINNITALSNGKTK